MKHRSESRVGNVSYEVGIDENLHTNLEVPTIFSEHIVSKCKHGCKIYKCEKSFLHILGHNQTYGCTRTKADIRRDSISA